MGRLLRSSMVGLKVTSSKMSYATGYVTRSPAHRASVPVAGHCRSVPPQETLKHSSGSVSVGSLGSGVHKILFESSEHLWCVWGLILKCENLSVMSDSLRPIDFIVWILQARILEWVTVSFPRGSSQPRDQPQVSHIAGGFFTNWATREAQRQATNIVIVMISSFKYYFKSDLRF